MVNGININLFDFQEKAVIKLLDIVTYSRSKQTVIVKSPTGSGKTIILIDFIEEYLTKINSRTAFIWLCPGKGDLEEQSRQKMRKFAPHRYTQNLFDALQNGFDAESTTRKKPRKIVAYGSFFTNPILFMLRLSMHFT